MTVRPLRRGVVAVVRQRGRFLMIRRSHRVEAPGTYCFPGGAIEAGESEIEALCREFREELGSPIRPLARVWRSVTPWRVALDWWSACLLDEGPFSPNPDEVESVHWLTPEELRRLPGLLASNRQFLDAWEAGAIALET
jgi:8-oxo-dGTP diphosphatase